MKEWKEQYKEGDILYQIIHIGFGTYFITPFISFMITENWDMSGRKRTFEITSLWRIKRMKP